MEYNNIEQKAKQLEEQRVWLKVELKKARMDRDEKKEREILGRINSFGREVANFNKHNK